MTIRSVSTVFYLSRDVRLGYGFPTRPGPVMERPAFAGTVVSLRRWRGLSFLAEPAELYSRLICRLTIFRSLGCRSSQNHCGIAFLREQGFDLNDENLEGKYKEWQKKLHPDLFHTKSEKEKTCAVEQSARVIDAYRTLSKPLSRALYLLQLAGIFVDEEKTLMDPELLSEMMDVREAIEEASDPKALMEIQHQIQRRHEDWSNSFREAFNKRDFDSALSATEKMRYYERAIEEIVKKL